MCLLNIISVKIRKIVFKAFQNLKSSVLIQKVLNGIMISYNRRALQQKEIFIRKCLSSCLFIVRPSFFFKLRPLMTLREYKNRFLILLCNINFKDVTHCILMSQAK